MNVLARETASLLMLSHKQKLTKDESVALTNYLKLIKDLKKEEDAGMENLSDEELEKLAGTK